MAGLLYRLGRSSARHRWLVVVAWLVLLGLTGAGYGLFGGAIAATISIPGTATSRVTDRLADGFPSASGGSGSLVFRTADGGAFTPQQQAGVASLLRTVDGYPGVRSVNDPFTTQAQLDDRRQQVVDGRQRLEDGQQRLTAARDRLDDGQRRLDAAQDGLDAQRAQAEAAGAPAAVRAQLDAGQAQIDQQQQGIDDGRATLEQNVAQAEAGRTELALGARLLALSDDVRFVSEDGGTAIGTVSFRRATSAVPPELKARIVELAERPGIDGVEVDVANDIAQGVPSVLGPGEAVGLLVAAVALIVILGTLIGAALPLASALLGVGTAILGALSFSSLIEFVSVTPVLAVMLGLAVGIDYSLFIINRHRNQLRLGMDVHESIGLANGTSGNAVVFAGSTVIVALLALNITGIPFLGLMGTVGAVAVAVAILVAVTFTPALLGFVGMRVLRRKERARIGRAAAKPLPSTPMRTGRAVVVLIAGVAVLGAVALPALQMRLGLPVGSSEAQDSTQYRAYTAIDSAFGAGRNGPLLVVADLPAPATGTPLLQQQAEIGEALAARDHVDAVLPIGTSSDGALAAFQVVPTGGPDSESTEALVQDLRDLSPVTVDAGRATLGVAGNASANIDVSENLGAVLPVYLAVVIGLSLLILIVVFRSILVPLTATAGFVLSLLATFGGLTAIFQFGWLGAVFGVHDPAPILSFLPIIQMGILFGLAMDYQLFLVSGMREAWAHGVPARVAVRRGLHAGRAVVTAAAIIMIAVFSGFIFSESSTIRPIGFGLAFGVLVDAFVVRLLLVPAAMHLLGDAAWWLPRWLEAIVPDVDVEGSRLERSHPVEAVRAGSGAADGEGSAGPVGATADR